jgi:hypothetical protein
VTWDVHRRLLRNAKALEEQLTDTTSISLTARCLHHGTDNRTGRSNLATANLLGNIWRFSKRSIDGLKQRAIIGHDRKTASSDDLIWRAFTSKYTLDYLTGELVVKGTFTNEGFHAGHVSRSDGQFDEFDSAIVSDTGQLTNPPLTSRGLIGTEIHCLCHEIESARAHNGHHVEVGDTPCCLEASLVNRWVLWQFGP